MHWYYHLSIDIIKILFRIVICPAIIFFPDIFTTITLIHKQIIAMAGYYACGAFIGLQNNLQNFRFHVKCSVFVSSTCDMQNQDRNLLNE